MDCNEPILKSLLSVAGGLGSLPGEGDPGGSTMATAAAAPAGAGISRTTNWAVAETVALDGASAGVPGGSRQRCRTIKPEIKRNRLASLTVALRNSHNLEDTMFDRDPLSRTVCAQGSDFGETMSVLRTWLDSQKIQPTIFKAAPDGDLGYVFTIGFRSPEDADRLGAEFANPSRAALAA